jgi:hypothetical protein
MPDHLHDAPDHPEFVDRVHVAILAVLQLAMLAELVLLLSQGRSVHVFLVVGIMMVTAAPIVARRWLTVAIPSEVQIAAILFIFATLFLGEVRDYYERIWWWDMALHATAGPMLGLLGFMIVYILNEHELVDLRMRPSFVALFAFFFSLGIGALWEIFEFGMDQLFGLTMQKPTASDPSGLSDTMRDLIIDASGAALISLAGWRFIKRDRKFVVDSWTKRFIARNPRLFGMNSRP